MSKRSSELFLQRIEQLHEDHIQGQSALAGALRGFGENLIGGLLIGAALLSKASVAAALNASLQAFADEIQGLVKKKKLLELVADAEERSPNLTFSYIVSFLVWNDWDRDEAEQMLNDLIAMGIVERYQNGNVEALRFDHDSKAAALDDLRHRALQVVDRLFDWMANICRLEGNAEALQQVENSRQIMKEHLSEE